MILKGLRFGMLLQLAVGPICLMVFHTSTTYGVIYGLHLVLAIALVDTLYIALSCVGVAAIIKKGKINEVIKVIGCLVLVLFGANTIAGVFNLSFMPHIPLFSNVSGKNLFVQGLLLTASNPLTIVFWSGMFSTQMVTVFDKGIIIKSLKIVSQPTLKCRHWRQRRHFCVVA